MENKKFEQRKKRARAMNRALKKLIPQVGTALNWSNPWELVVAVSLSAQCTDVQVNKVTEKLFKKYKKLDDYLKAKPREFEQDIKSTGFYKNKAKNVLAAAKILKEDFGGIVPQTVKELMTLPGVGKKTANVVLGNAFNIISGVPVDTHVRRFAIRFDLSDYKDPKRIEEDLQELLPKKDWFSFASRLITYGRTVCPARKHDCAEHPLTKIYPEANNRWPRSK